MSPHFLPQSTIRRDCSRFAIVRFLLGSVRCFAIALALGGIAGAASADPEPSLPFRSATVSDTVLARSVLVAIDTDPELRGVNLVVSIVDGVAVIGGPVSSTSVVKRAEWVVRRVPGIKDVKNGCFVASGPDPLMTALAEKLGTSRPPRTMTAELPGVLTGPQPAGWSAPATPTAQNPSLVAVTPNSNTVVAQKPPPPAGGGLGVLGAPVSPVALGSAPAPIGVGGRDFMTVPARLTASGIPAQPTTNDILTSAGNVKKVEARFANLTIELNNGILLIGGTSPKASDAWDLAEKLRQIPGVSRVVIGAMPGK